MRRRLHPKKTPDAEPGLEVVRVEAVRLVTLEDPKVPPTPAQDAFARLRPPEGMTPEAVTSWRDTVAKVAKAVQVVATTHAAAVPLKSTRVDLAVKVGSIREEAKALAAETNDGEVIAMVDRLLDEVGA